MLELWARSVLLEHSSSYFGCGENYEDSGLALLKYRVRVTGKSSMLHELHATSGCCDVAVGTAILVGAAIYAGGAAIYDIATH
jgi:hypothetical protein